MNTGAVRAACGALEMEIASTRTCTHGLCKVHVRAPYGPVRAPCGPVRPWGHPYNHPYGARECTYVFHGVVYKKGNYQDIRHFEVMLCRSHMYHRIGMPLIPPQRLRLLQLRLQLEEVEDRHAAILGAIIQQRQNRNPRRRRRWWVRPWIGPSGPDNCRAEPVRGPCGARTGYVGLFRVREGPVRG